MCRIDRKRDRGSATVEFSLSSLIWLPLLLGTVLFGMALVQSLQVGALSRDSGHMYAFGIDFTTQQNSALLGRLASPLGIQQSSGNGAILLSRVTYVTKGDCAAAGEKVCPNTNKYVFTNFYAFGNLAYAQTQLGTPSLNYIRNGNSISVQQYLSDPALVATTFSTYLQFSKDPSGDVQPGQYAYVSEVTLNSQSINWATFNNTRAYARTIF